MSDELVETVILGEVQTQPCCFSVSDWVFSRLSCQQPIRSKNSIVSTNQKQALHCVNQSEASIVLSQPIRKKHYLCQPIRIKNYLNNVLDRLHTSNTDLLIVSNCLNSAGKCVHSFKIVNETLLGKRSSRPGHYIPFASHQELYLQNKMINQRIWKKWKKYLQIANINLTSRAVVAGGGT